MMNTAQDFAIPATCAMDDDDGDGWGDFEAPHGGIFLLLFLLSQFSCGMKDLFPLVWFLIRCVVFFPGFVPVPLDWRARVMSLQFSVAAYAVSQDVDFALAEADGVA